MLLSLNELLLYSTEAKPILAMVNYVVKRLLIKFNVRVFFFFHVQVLDARDPQGTRCFHLEKHLKEKCMHKHMVLLLNKVGVAYKISPLLHYSAYSFSNCYYCSVIWYQHGHRKVGFALCRKSILLWPFMLVSPNLLARLVSISISQDS